MLLARGRIFTVLLSASDDGGDVCPGSGTRTWSSSARASSQVLELESAADAGEVLISDDTAALVPASWLGPTKHPGTLLRRTCGVPSTGSQILFHSRDEDQLWNAADRVAQRPDLIGAPSTTGGVFAGTVGAPFRCTYAALGDATQSRRPPLREGRPGTVLAHAPTLTSSLTQFAQDPVFHVELKGKPEPVSVATVTLGIGNRGRRDHRRAGPGKSRAEDRSCARSPAHSHQVLDRPLQVGETPRGEGDRHRPEPITRERSTCSRSTPRTRHGCRRSRGSPV